MKTILYALSALVLCTAVQAAAPGYSFPSGGGGGAPSGPAGGDLAGTYPNPTLGATNTNLTTLANVTTVGTIGTGTWQATVIGNLYGGIGKVVLTQPATAATLTILNNKTLTANNSLTLAGTDGTTETFPSTSASIARTDAGQTFTGVQVMTSPSFTTPALGTVASGVISACTSSGMVLTAPVLGTPASGTLTNCSGLPASGVLNPTGNAQSGTTYTFVLADGYGGVVVSGSNSGATTFSIPTNANVAFPLYTSIVVLQLGAGAITINAVTSGTTTVTSSGATSAAPIINAQYQAAVCYKTATDAWTVFGNIK